MMPALVNKANRRIRRFINKRISEPFAGAASAAAGTVVPFQLYRRINSRAPAVVCYHTVRDESPRHIMHLHGCHSVKTFERQLDDLLRYFEPIDDPAPENILNGGSHTMLLTFDDGLREIYDIVAPILERKGINAVFFIIPSFIDNQELFYCYKTSLLIDAMKESGAGGDSFAAIGELLKDHGCLRGSIDDSLRRIRYKDKFLLDSIAEILGVDYKEYLRRVRPFLTRAEVEDLHNRGFIIGAHSMDHPRYHEVTADEQVRQTVESARTVQEWLQCRYAYFAFPFYMKGLAPDFFQRTGEEIDLYFSTDGWLPPDSGNRVVHRTELDDHRDIFKRLKLKGKIFPASLRTTFGISRQRRKAHEADELLTILKQAVALYRGGNGAAGCSLLADALGEGAAGFTKLPGEYMRQYLDTVHLIEEGGSDTSAVIDGLVTQTRDMNVDAVSVDGWLGLYRLSIVAKMFGCAYVARQKAVDRALADAADRSSTTEQTRRAIIAAIDRFDRKTVECLLERYRADATDISDYTSLGAYYDLNRGALDNARSKWNVAGNENDRRFGELIDGRSAAIVGPAAGEAADGEEIDSFDLVIRCNYRGRRSMPDPVRYGSRVDISYYNNMTAEHIGGGGRPFPAELKFAVYKNRGHANLNDPALEHRIRIAHRNCYYFNGTPNMIQIILYDLFHFNPLRVKLFKVDFYLSPIRYYDAYLYSNRFSETDYLRNDFADHDSLAQFTFVKNMWNAGLIEADAVCTAALSLDQREVMVKLDELYGTGTI